MTSALRPSALLLFLGDIIFFFIALWLSLFLRWFVPPSQSLFMAHVDAFVPLFAVWALVFFIAGLYEGRRIILARRALSSTLLSAQTINVALAALFFFLVPTFGIAPKTVLVIYLVVSFLLILLWRAFLFPILGLQKASVALVVGDSAELHELLAALASSSLAPVRAAEVISPEANHLAERVRQALAVHHPQFIIADLNHPHISGAFPELYNLLATGTRFIDTQALYEEVFGRVPLSLVDDRWIARNVSQHVHALYDILKRLLDIVLGGAICLLSLLAYPIIMAAIYLESGQPIFITQERVGEGNKVIRLFKFRTMTGNDNGNYKGGVSRLRITKVGRFLRTTRLDELPQLLNVLGGELSLIGPRPEFPALVAQYEKEIPYYGVRHLIRPGLSGWAQLYHDNHPHHGTNTEATREKLSYDLYYLKHRSLMLDGVIALKTIAKVVTRSGA